MFIYCICAQYLVGAPFALITASIRRGMEVISLWHCWGGMKPRFLWQWPSAHLHFLVSCFSFSSWQYPIDSLCSGLVSLLASQAHQHHGHLTNFWCFGSVDRCQILLENEISIFKKLVSRRKHEVLQNFLVNGCSDVSFQKTQWTNTSRWHCTPDHHRLWKLNTGLQATWAMSFSTLPPDSWTLVSNFNMLGYSTLWTASFFGNECLWLTLLEKGVNDCLLDNCQISSLPHNCVA